MSLRKTALAGLAVATGLTAGVLSEALRGRRAVHSAVDLSHRALRPERHSDRERDERLLHADQRARRRHQRRQADLGRVRDRVQQRPWRRVLRAPEEERRDRRLGDQPVQHRHHLRADRAGLGGQDPRALDGLRPHRRQRRPRLPLRVHRADDLLEPGLGADQVHRRPGRRHGQSEGQEDRPGLPRQRLRQGADPDAREAGADVSATSCRCSRWRIPASSRSRPGSRSGGSSGPTGC